MVLAVILWQHENEIKLQTIKHELAKTFLLNL